MSPENIETGYKKHAALTQLHRWYLLYEEPQYGIENALDILAKNIRIESGLGEANGHAQYAERVQQLPATWKNAHTVNSPTVTVQDDGSLLLNTNVSYLNQGLLENGGVRTADLTYTMSLTSSDSVLPNFSDIEITQNSDGTTDKFVPRYAENKLKSLVHYWLALVEDPSRDPAPFQEILAKNFHLDFTGGAITDFDGFKQWLAGPGSQVKASTHAIGNFSYTTEDEETYTVSMEFDWNGILHDNTQMTAKTLHSWTVKDDPSKRFAQIQRMSVDVLEPFTPSK